MSIAEENLIPYEGELKAGQRLIKIGNAFIPVGVGGAFEPAADRSDATVTADKMLEGVTGYGAFGKVTGRIQSLEAGTYTPWIEDQTIAAGKYLSGTQTIKGDPDLTAENIKSGTDIFGVVGTFTADGTAVAGDILSGKTAYVGGQKITGNIASQSAKTYTPGIADQTIAAGKYLSGAQTIKGDTSLVPENIKKGVSIFNTAGTFTGASSGGGETSFYQCASVDTTAGTWTGYKWILNEDGIYVLEGELTTDELTITGFVPLVGSSYSANTLIVANKLYEGILPIPTDGIVFYASLAEDTLSADTGETMTEIGDVTHAVIANVPCAKMSGNSGAYRITGLSLPHGNSTRTISYWVNFIDFDSSRNVVWGYGTGNDYRYLDSVFSATQYKNGGKDDDGYTDDATVNYPFEVGKWYSIILTTADGKTFFLYVDGVLAGSMTHSYNGLPQSGRTLCLGKTGRYISDSDYWSTVGMNGYLAGFRFYNRVLTEYDIRALASEFTPTAYIVIDATLSIDFKLNEAISHSLDVKDSLGNACSYEIVSGTLPTGVNFDASTGTFSGTPTAEGEVNIVVRCYTKKAEKEVTVTFEVKGITIPEEGLVFHVPLSSASATAITGQALSTTGTISYTEKDGIQCAYFDGTSYITSSDVSALSFGNGAKTISARVYTDSSVSSENENPFLFYGSEYEVGLRYFKGFNYVWGTDGYDGGVTTTEVSKDTWRLFTGVWDGSVGTVYIDGVAYATSTNSQDTGNGIISIGYCPRNGAYGKAYIADVRIYDRALSPEEVRELYETT